MITLSLEFDGKDKECMNSIQAVIKTNTMKNYWMDGGCIEGWVMESHAICPCQEGIFWQIPGSLLIAS